MLEKRRYRKLTRQKTSLGVAALVTGYRVLEKSGFALRCCFSR